MVRRRNAMVSGLLLLLLLLAACQPLPRPFADDRPPIGDPMLAVLDGAGIFIQPVAGAPAPATLRLAEAMALALLGQDVPASTRSENRQSFVLHPLVTETPLAPKFVPPPKPVPSQKPVPPKPKPVPIKVEKRVALDIEWVLHAPGGGDVVGRHRQHIEILAEPWHRGDTRLMETLAKSAAPQIAALLQADTPVAGASAVADRPPVLIPPVQGAPGDGARSLSRAMVGALHIAHYEAEAEKTPDAGKGVKGRANAFTLAGTVRLDPPIAGKQNVRISWRLLAPDGGEIGTVGQENAVPAGSLNGAWGDIAYAVAGAAAEGVVSLLEKVKSQGATQ